MLEEVWGAREGTGGGRGAPPKPGLGGGTGRAPPGGRASARGGAPRPARGRRFRGPRRPIAAPLAGGTDGRLLADGTAFPNGKPRSDPGLLRLREPCSWTR